MTTMMKKMIVVVGLLLMAAVVATPFSASAQDGVSLQGVDDSAQTGINFQHTGTSTDGANVNVQLLPQGGGTAVDLPVISLGQNGVGNIFLPFAQTTEGDAVPAGDYSLVASSGDSIGAIVRTEFPGTGAAGIYGSVAPGETVVVPLVTREYAGQSSIITVQSAGQSGSTFDVAFVAIGDSLAAPTFENNGQTLDAGRSVTYDLRTSDFDTLVGGGGDIAPNGFLGFVQVTVTSGDPVVVQSLIDILGIGAATSFNGVPADSASQTLYAPLLRANFFGDTGIQLVNPNNDPANVDITFLTDPISQDAGYAAEYTQSFQIDGNGGFNAFQGPTGNSRGGTGIPEDVGGPAPNSLDGWLGAGIISSDQPLLAVVNDVAFSTGFAPTSQGTYNTVTATDAGTSFALPLVRSKNVTNQELTVGVQVLNIDPNNDAEVSITVTNSDEADDPETLPSRTIAAQTGSNFYFGDNSIGGVDVPNLFDPIPGVGGWFGSAIVEATGGDIVVIVNDANFPGATSVFDSANYNGIPLQ
jgi:hypothetical protein